MKKKNKKLTLVSLLLHDILSILWFYEVQQTGIFFGLLSFDAILDVRFPFPLNFFSSVFTLVFACFVPYWHKKRELVDETKKPRRAVPSLFLLPRVFPIENTFIFPDYLKFYTFLFKPLVSFISILKIQKGCPEN